MIMLNEQDIIHIMMGATLMAGGGGGALEDGMELIHTYKKDYPGKEMKCALYSVDEMKDGEYTIGLAVMGSPVEGGKVDATNCIITAFKESQSLKHRTGRAACYTLSMELGGFNTFTPILISMIEGIPMVDADCAGRAVPGLETAISHVNGLPTGPYVMGSIQGDAYVVVPKDPYDAAGCQEMALPIVKMFEQNAGMAGWMYSRSELEQCVPTGTIGICKRIGEEIDRLRKQQKEDGLPFVGDMFKALNESGVVKARTLVQNAYVSAYCPQPGVTGNNDIGYYEVKESEGALSAYRVHYANESLVLGVVKDGREEIVMTVPDITTMYDSSTGLPLTNEDITLAHEKGTLEDLRLTLGVIKVDEKWWKNESRLMEYWKKYFDEIGYEGKIIKGFNHI